MFGRSTDEPHHSIQQGGHGHKHEKWRILPPPTFDLHIPLPLEGGEAVVVVVVGNNIEIHEIMG